MYDSDILNLARRLLLPSHSYERIEQSVEYACHVYARDRSLPSDATVQHALRIAEETSSTYEYFLDEKLQVDPQTGATVRSFIALVGLLSNPEITYGEFSSSFLPSKNWPSFGVLRKVAYADIRPFLHPNNGEVNLHELRGRYLAATVLMEVLTSCVLAELGLPRANRVFWGLGGALFFIHRDTVSALARALDKVNISYDLASLGLSVRVADETSDAASPAPLTEVSSEFESSGFFAEYAKRMMESTRWRFCKGSDSPFAQSVRGSPIATLRYWIGPADLTWTTSESFDPKIVADLAPIPNAISGLSLSALSDNPANPLTYIRLDIIGMRQALRRSADAGLIPMYRQCHEMASFFRQTIPELCRSLPRSITPPPQVLLLHSTCDDIVLIVTGRSADEVAIHLSSECYRITGKTLAHGAVVLNRQHTASSLSFAGHRQLVKAKQQKRAEMSFVERATLGQQEDTHD